MTVLRLLSSMRTIDMRFAKKSNRGKVAAGEEGVVRKSSSEALYILQFQTPMKIVISLSICHHQLMILPDHHHLPVSPQRSPYSLSTFILPLQVVHFS